MRVDYTDSMGDFHDVDVMTAVDVVTAGMYVDVNASERTDFEV